MNPIQAALDPEEAANAFYVQFIEQVKQEQREIRATIERFVHGNVLFKNVEDKQGLIKELMALAMQPEFELDIEEMVEELNHNPNFQWTPILQDPKTLNLILLAYMRGELGEYQMATAHVMASVLERYSSPEARGVLGPDVIGYEEVPIFFSNGEVNPLARSLLMQTLQKVNEVSEFFFQILTPEKIDHLIEEMRKLPVSEQRFIIGEHYHAGTKEIERSKTAKDADGNTLTIYENILSRFNLPPLEQPEIMDSVYEEAGFNIFSRVMHEGRVMRMVPSLGMFDKLIEGIEGDKLRVFMLGAGKDAWEGKGRVYSLNSKWARTPPVADTYPAPFEAFSTHDAFHCLKLAYIKESHREVFSAFTQKMLESPQFIEHPEFVTPFINRMKDLEVIYYEPGGKGHMKKLGIESEDPDEQLGLSFWMAVHQISYNTNLRARLYAVLENERIHALARPEERKTRGQFEMIIHDLNRYHPVLEGAVQYAIRELFVNDTRLVDAAKITLRDLEKVSNALPSLFTKWPIHRMAAFVEEEGLLPVEI